MNLVIQKTRYSEYTHKARYLEIILVLIKIKIRVCKRIIIRVGIMNLLLRIRKQWQMATVIVPLN